MRSHRTMFNSYWRWKPFALGSVPSSSHCHTVNVFQFYNCIDVGLKWCTSSSHNIILDQLARLREALLQRWWAACKVGSTSGPNSSPFCILVLSYQDTIFLSTYSSGRNLCEQPQSYPVVVVFPANWLWILFVTLVGASRRRNIHHILYGYKDSDLSELVWTWGTSFESQEIGACSLGTNFAYVGLRALRFARSCELCISEYLYC